MAYVLNVDADRRAPDGAFYITVHIDGCFHERGRDTNEPCRYWVRGIPNGKALREELAKALKSTSTNCRRELLIRECDHCLPEGGLS